MAKQFTTSDDFPIMPPKPVSLTFGSSSSSGAVVDDDVEEDACSICLDPFSNADPAAVTCCKHEYHLHCILEWSRRSKECPICWQSLVLKDPVSQELLVAAQTEMSSRQKCQPTRMPSYSQHYSQHDFELDAADGSDFHEHIMQHIATAMSRDRYVHRSDRRRSPEAGSSQAPFIMPSVNGPNRRHSAYGSSSNISPTSGISSEIDGQHPFFPVSSVGRSDSPDILRLRTLRNQLQHDETQRPKSSELLAFSESIKSRLSSASNRCKDSISKGKQGFREKFLAHNDSVKELSKGVQREMSLAREKLLANNAGLAKMIERLDLKSKRNGNSGQGFRSSEGTTSNMFSKGKGVQEDVVAAAYPLEKHIEAAHDLCLDEPSSVTYSVPSSEGVSRPRRSTK